MFAIKILSCCILPKGMEETGKIHIKVSSVTLEIVLVSRLFKHISVNTLILVTEYCPEVQDRHDSFYR